MRQIMPHRNNIGGAGRSCKSFLTPLRRLPSKALLAGERRRPGTGRRFGNLMRQISNLRR